MAKNQISADVEFQGLISQTPGQGANNSSPFAQYGDLFSDALLSGGVLAVPSPASLSATLPLGVAAVLGQRVPFPATPFSVAASSTSYLDLSNTGALTVTTSGTVTANSLRLWSVTSSATAITAVTQIAPNGLSTTSDGFTYGTPGTEGYLQYISYTTGGAHLHALGIYYAATGTTLGISTTLPAPPNWTTIGGYYEGMGIQGAVSGVGSPVFGVLNSTQSGNGIGAVALTVYDNNKIQTFNSTLDDGAGNMTVAGTVLSRLSVASTTTAGNITLTAAQLAGGYFVDSATQTAAFTFTTDTAANMLTALPNAAVGTSFKFRFINNDQSAGAGYLATMVAGTGVTISPILPNPTIGKAQWNDFIFTFTNVTPGSAAVTAYEVGGASGGLL